MPPLRQVLPHAVLALVLLSVHLRAQTGVGPTPAEATLLAMANGARAAHGLPALRWDPALARAARIHATRMATEPGEMLHTYRGEPDLLARASGQGARFSTVAENLARGGPSPADLGAIWMQTPVHRANILDARMDAAGIAIVELRGTLYAVEDLAAAVSAPEVDVIESGVLAALHRAGLEAAGATSAARNICSGTGDTPPGTRLVIQWDGPNPTQLPDALIQQIARGSFRGAAVGACRSREGNPAFTTSRVAVLLF